MSQLNAEHDLVLNKLLESLDAFILPTDTPFKKTTLPSGIRSRVLKELFHLHPDWKPSSKMTEKRLLQLYKKQVSQQPLFEQQSDRANSDSAVFSPTKPFALNQNFTPAGNLIGRQGNSNQFSDSDDEEMTVHGFGFNSPCLSSSATKSSFWSRLQEAAASNNDKPSTSIVHPDTPSNSCKVSHNVPSTPRSRKRNKPDTNQDSLPTDAVAPGSDEIRNESPTSNWNEFEVNRQCIDDVKRENRRNLQTKKKKKNAKQMASPSTSPTSSPIGYWLRERRPILKM